MVAIVGLSLGLGVMITDIKRGSFCATACNIVLVATVSHIRIIH